MADDSDKTEEPTEKRKREARKKGQVAKSQDLNSGAVLFFALLALVFFGEHMGDELKLFMVQTFLQISTFDLNITNLVQFGYKAVFAVAWAIYPILIVLVIAGVLINVLQTGFLVSTYNLQPKFSKIFKMEGIKKLFSPTSLVELVKNMAKMLIVVWIGYDVIMSRYSEILGLVEKEIGSFLALLLSISFEISIKVALLLLLLGILDFIYQKRKTYNSMKMTKEEVKDERKQSEGDPEVKKKIRQTMMEMYQKMMMQEVPKATVVITNPTFIAIAIGYKRGVDSVPKVLAKGKRLTAERIRDIARENEIPIVEDKPLARAMYDIIEPGDALPEEFFNAVAEVLAYVYSMKSGNSTSPFSKVQEQYV